MIPTELGSRSPYPQQPGAAHILALQVCLARLFRLASFGAEPKGCACEHRPSGRHTQRLPAASAVAWGRQPKAEDDG